MSFRALFGAFDSPLPPALPYVDPPWPEVAQAGQLRSALLDPGQLSYRRFHNRYCSHTYELNDLSEIFSSHALEWNILGRDAPWWSVISVNKWKGKRQITEAGKREFYDGGDAHVAEVHKAHPQLQGIVLDFGCGLGRLGMAFARLPNVSHVFCIDQSVHHLSIARDEWSRRRGQTTARLHFVHSTPDLLAAMRGRQVDFVHSVIVLQHMVPPLQQVYLEQLCDVLAPGGSGWIQIPTAVGHSMRSGIMTHGHCDLEASIRLGGAQMHATPLRFLKPMLAARGCAVLVEDVGGKYLGQPDSDTRWKSAVLHLRKTHASRSRMPAE